MKPQKGQSTGQMISTVCFFGMAVWLAGQARDSVDAPLNAAALWLTGLACLAGGLRFQIRHLCDRFNKRG